MRLFVIAALGLTLMAPAAVAKEKKGAELVVTKKDGTTVQGELLAVRGENLILMDVFTNQGLTESLTETSTIRVVRKNKFMKGLGRGFLYGCLGGAVLGLVADNENASLHGFELAAVCGLSLGVVGAVVGGIVGVAEGSDIIYVIKETDETYLAQIGSELRRMARDRS